MSVIMSRQKENNKRNALIEKNTLSTLHKYDIDDFAEDMEINELTKLINHICQTPIATISFLDENKFIIIGKSGVNENIHFVDHKVSFSQYTVLQDDIFEVPNALQDNRFINNPYVAGAPFIRYYCGTPLIAPDGTRIGSLCVLDTKERVLSETQKNAMKFLADVVIQNLELKTKKLELEKDKRRIENSEKRYRQLFELSQGLIGEHDMNGRIISANLATANSLEISIKNLVGKNMRDALSPETRDQFDFYLEKIAQDGYAEGIMHVQTTTGKSRYWAYKNVKVEDQGYPFVLCSSQDVTELITLEKELRRAKKIAEQSTEAKQHFLAKVTHEIRTPMNAIVGFGKLLLKTTLEEKQQKYSEAISTAGENLLLIVNDLLDTAKIEAGKMSFEEIPFSLQEVVSSVVTILHYKAAEKDIILSVKIADDIPANLIGDPTRLNQVLTNLAGNAVKFTEKGTVEISIQKEKITEDIIDLKIEVIDTGIGISADKLPFIFNSFIQANNDTSRKYGGTGLGLTIAKQIIELQNGTIDVKSEPEVGTSFTVFLSYQIATQQTVLINKNKEEFIADKKLDHVKILLAEDNHLNHLLLECIMEEWGAELSIAENGKQVIELLETNNYDLILMDVHMPIMDGYEATAFIRNNLPSPLNQIPIIAITANASEEDRTKCFNAGMNDFIPKPFRQEELFEKISRYAMLRKDSGLVYTKKEKNKKPDIKRKVIRLGYLKSVASGNKKFLKEVMDIFITQIPEELININHAVQLRSWEKVADIAHKMKLGINIMGMKDSEKIILYIEAEAREKITPDEKTIKIKIEKLKEKCLIAVEEVKELMIEWKL